MKKFIFCIKCKKVYPMNDPALTSIIDQLPEDLTLFTGNEIDCQREFCRREHSTEILRVLFTRSIAKDRGDLLNPVVFIAVNPAMVPIVVVKKRKKSFEPPQYVFYRNTDNKPLAVPASLLV